MTNTPSVDIAWAAGFLEGEGHFRAQKTIRGMFLRAAAFQKRKNGPLKRLCRIFGGKVIIWNHNNGGRKGLILYGWYVHGIRASEVMDHVYPLMSKYRRAQIDAAKTLYQNFHRRESELPSR